MNPLSFQTLREANRARQLEWPGNDKCDAAFRAIEVSGEGGEVVEALEELLTTALMGLAHARTVGRVAEKTKKAIRAERGITGSTAQLEELADEMADNIIALDLLADELGIDLGGAVTGKFNATSVKYDLRTRLAFLSRADFAVTEEEKRAQAQRCACRGSDDYCPCQNVADRKTMLGRKEAGE